MTVTEIYDRIEDLIQEIKKNPEDRTAYLGVKLKLLPSSS